MGAQQVLDVQVVAAASPSSSDEKDILVADFDVLRTLFLPLPNNAWRRVVNCSRTLPPMCRNLRSVISNDFESVARILSELEPWDCFDETVDDYDDPCPMNLGLSYVEPEPYSPQSRIRHIRWQSLCTDDPSCTMQSSHSSVPTIIITPCEPREHEISCHVPLQNCEFGGRLTVPRHPVFNQVFPPLSHSPHTLFANKKWKWHDGHWQATLPCLEEQTKNGLFSRALVTRRRSRRATTRR